jgi:predicted ABC-type ATPase
VAKECERFVLDHIERAKSFAVETTLRTTAAVEQADLARKHGFSTELLFIATDSIAENIARVLQRAQGGGHGASERDVRAIHAASIANLRKALAVFDHASIYDSTPSWIAPRLVAVAQNGRVVCRGPSPAWLERALSTSEP